MRDYEEYDESSEQLLARARKSVAAPGMFLVIFGILATLIVVGWFAVSIAYPEAMYDAIVWCVKRVYPPGKLQVDTLAIYEAQKNEMMLDKPVNFITHGLSLVLSMLVVVGGLRMRALQSWGLALTAAILATIPMTGCSCFFSPFGLWALIVLCNAKVRKGFELTRQRSA